MPAQAAREVKNIASTTEPESVSSLNTQEKLENKEAQRKLAGEDFNFAKEFSRKTMSRKDLTEMVQSKFNILIDTAVEVKK